MANLSNITSRGIRGAILQGLAAQPVEPWLASVARRVTSDQAIETYADIGTTPVMREWAGGRQPKEPREISFQIANVEYEATVQIPYKDIRRARGKIDGGSKLDPYINGLTTRAAQHFSKLATDLIVAGESTACYDGQFFFDTDHSEANSGTQSNDLSVDISALPTQVHGAAATDPSPGEFSYAAMEGVIALLGFKDDEGEPSNEDASSFVVHCPLGLYAAARVAMGNTMGESGGPNPLTSTQDNFTMQLVPSARLTAAGWTDKFVVYRADGNERAVILQEEEAPRTSAKAENSEFFHDNNAWEFGIAASRAAGYGDWKQACLVTLV